MSKFSKLKKMDVTVGKTVDYVLYGLEGAPILVLAPATEANKPFLNAALKKSGAAQRQLKQQKITPEYVEDSRLKDARLYADHIVKGWKKVKDDNNKAVKFTVEDAHDYLLALPGYMFDEVRVFASEARNFIEDTIVNADDVSGN